MIGIPRGLEDTMKAMDEVCSSDISHLTGVDGFIDTMTMRFNLSHGKGKRKKRKKRR